MISKSTTTYVTHIKRQMKNLARGLLTLTAGLSLVLITTSASAQRTILDRVVAIVDEGVILQSELDRRMQEIRQQAQQNNRPLPPADQLQEQVIESLILENLQLQMADRMSIRFDDDTLNRVMANMAEASNMTFDEYVSALESQSVYLSTREQIRRELAVRELQRGVVNRRINITDQEIQNYLNSEMGRVTMAPDYLVDHMLIPIAEGDSQSVINAKGEFARSIYETIRAGEDFVQVRMLAQRDAAQARDPNLNASQSSSLNAGATASFPVGGSDLGWRKADQLPTLFAEVVPDMDIGEVSEPIRSSNGYHLIKLTDVRGDANRLVHQTHARHLMISPNEIRTEEQARALIGELRERIVNGEDFATLARQNSDDTASVVAGGDLGWASRGGMPPEFEAKIDELEIGELSEPFRTESGWHIAEVIDRREQDLSRQFLRRQAENSIRERKFDLELENWLIEIREQAYVKLNI